MSNSLGSEGSILDLIENFPEVTLAEIGLGKDKDLVLNPKQKFANMDCYNRKWDQNEVGAKKTKLKHLLTFKILPIWILIM
ncbi:hypothetical protein F8M41_021651 [Gigaspora margarita]|uniref:Uncharacterized protein n=1 Tax=Gigaspora margarita TaxID=4874 RepID=A0A8H4ETM7_GIGMA|nr:hypothetical protein F8M41_021651 [Gigaspora margarita]